jgi:cob(I)alamin adenosyltransferase
VNPEHQTLTGWVVAVVLMAITGTLAFLIRHSFTKFESTLELVSKKIDELGASVAKADGDRRVSDAKHEALEKRVEKLERLVEELSEGIAR